MGQRVVRDALVMPLRGTLDQFQAGVFVDGVCCEESLLYRAGALAGSAADAGTVSQALATARRLPGDWLFGGYLFRHYGHFLFETLSRISVLRHCPPRPLLFGFTHRDLVPWQREIFRLLGLRNEIVLHGDPVIPERLVLSTPGFVMPEFILPDQIEALGVLRPPPRSERRIWLARSSHIGGGLVNERALEPELVRRGWEIVHPQYMPVRQQVELIASARHVAGLDGSAFHTALLAAEVRGTFTIFMLRNTQQHSYTRIATMKGISQREIPLLPHTRFLLGEGAERFYQLESLDVILDNLP